MISNKLPVPSTLKDRSETKQDIDNAVFWALCFLILGFFIYILQTGQDCLVPVLSSLVTH